MFQLAIIWMQTRRHQLEKQDKNKSERLFYSYSEFVRVKTVPRVFPEAQSLTPKQGVLCNSGKKKNPFYQNETLCKFRSAG